LARELLTFKEDDIAALSGKQRRCGRARGPPADHDDIVRCFRGHSMLLVPVHSVAAALAWESQQSCNRFILAANGTLDHSACFNPYGTDVVRQYAGCPRAEFQDRCERPAPTAHLRGLRAQR